VPVQPSANVENSRCKTHPIPAYAICNGIETPGSRISQSPIRGTSNLNDSALQRCRDSMRPRRIASSARVIAISRAAMASSGRRGSMLRAA
jgi:hypothetical protein